MGKISGRSIFGDGFLKNHQPDALIIGNCRFDIVRFIQVKDCPGCRSECIRFAAGFIDDEYLWKRWIEEKAREIGYEPVLLRSVMSINETQPVRMVQLLKKRLPELKDKKIAVLGLAFKNDTDDIRESRSIQVIKELLDSGAKVSAYDPMANENMKKLFGDVEYQSNVSDALKGAYACLVMTEWDEFKALDKEFDVMENKLIIDGRHMLRPRNNIEYIGLCW